MGRVKEMWMDSMENPVADVPYKLVSVHLFKNKLLHDLLSKTAFDEADL